MLRLIAAVVTVLFGTNVVAAQSPLYHVRHFSVEDGLSGRDVTSVAQDSTGLIWIGNSQGLNSFDGEDFRVWTDTSGLLANNRVAEIVPAPNGELYLINGFRQPLRFNPYTRSLGQIEGVEVQKNNRLGSISPAPGAKTIFFLNRENELHVKSGAKIIKVEKYDNRRSRYISTIWNSLLKIPLGTDTLREIDHKGKTIRSVGIPSNFSSQILILPEGRHTGVVTFVYDHPISYGAKRIFNYSKEGKLNPIPLNLPAEPERNGSEIANAPAGRIAFARTANGQYWIAFLNSLILFDRNGDFLKDLSPLLAQKTNVDWTPNNLFIDADQRVWLATGAGVFVISSKPNPFIQYLRKDDHLPIRGIVKLQNNRLLVGTNRANRANRVIDLTTGKETELDLKGTLLGMTKGPNGNYFGGSHGRRISKITPDLKVSYDDLETIPGINLPLPYYDSLTNTYFIGSSFGLYTAHEFKPPVREYKVSDNPKLFSDKEITHFYRNKQGLWISGGDGLYLMAEEGKTSLRFKVKGPTIKHFHEDKNGLFWIATSGSGLFRWEPKTNSSKQYTTNDGLTHNVIYAVYEDELGSLWLPSNKGLMQFDPKTELVNSFQTSDGITHEEFNTFSHFQADDGRLFFGTLNGITAFYPKDVRPTTPSDIPLRLTGLEKYNSKRNVIEDKLAEVKASNKLILAPGDKSFTLTFALQDYSSDVISYAWKLLPQDEKWTYQKDNSVRINGLSAGEHQLIIKANNSAGVSDGNALMLNIRVLRPFYQRWPFLTVFGLGLALLVWAYIRYRTRRIEAEKRQLAVLVEQRTSELARKNTELAESNSTKNRLFALISHDLRAPVISLRGITRKVQYLVKENRYAEVISLSETIDSAVKNTQYLLDNLLSWAMHQDAGIPYTPEEFDLRELLMSNHELLSLIAENKKVKLETILPDSALNVFADPTGIATILRNLADNAIKFTAAGKSITISTSVSGDKALINVTDEGIGIPSDRTKQLFQIDNRHSSIGTEGEKGVGLGLLLSRDIALKNKGRLRLLASSATGTAFQLSIPLASTL